MIGVAIMGCGIVGSGVMRMLTENAAQVSRAAGCEVALVGVLDVRPIEVQPPVSYTSDFETLIKDERVSIAVETIGGAGVAYQFTKRMLQSGRSVVSSNKELVAAHGDELTRLAKEHGCMYLYEASVGGGVPILRPLGACLAGNNITRIDGIVNGSTNYLLTRMEERGTSFPAALEEARALGYVEGNPAADVEGWDARRKLGILAATAFGAAFSDNEKIPTEGISRISERDLTCARALGGTIKLIAHAQRMDAGWSGWVHPALVMPGHPLFEVRDVFNGILVHGDFVDDVVFIGRGAGSRPTASAVVGDVIDVARHAGRAASRGAWRETPAFVEEQAALESQRMLRVEGNGVTGAREKIESCLEGARVERVGDMYAALTPRWPAGRLDEAVRRLSEGGLSTGIIMRVL